MTLTAVDDPAVISGDISYSGNEGDAVGGDMDASDVEGLTDGTYFTVTGAATNGTAVIDPVWSLLAQAYDRLGPVPTLLERDFNLPPLAVLLQEVAQIRDIQRRALESGVRSYG